MQQLKEIESKQKERLRQERDVAMQDYFKQQQKLMDVRSGASKSPVSRYRVGSGANQAN